MSFKPQTTIIFTYLLSCNDSNRYKSRNLEKIKTKLIRKITLEDSDSRQENQFSSDVTLKKPFLKRFYSYPKSYVSNNTLFSNVSNKLVTFFRFRFVTFFTRFRASFRKHTENVVKGLF